MGNSREMSIDSLGVRVFKIPTEGPESDGTLCWDHTVVVVVTVQAAGVSGLGYTYSHQAAASVVETTLSPLIEGGDAMAISEHWWRMRRAVRNLGDHGITASAIAAVDMALWDLKARLLGLSLVDLLGPVRQSVPIYGSGGFTSESLDELCAQLGTWVEEGIPRVKMKVGREIAADPDRVRAAREAIGDSAELFVDANAGYTPQQASAMAERFADFRVTWFEEPVSSRNLAELRLVRQRAPASMAVAAGEYHWSARDARLMLEARAVDVMQVDVTRCMGISGLLDVHALCAAHSIPLSLHTAPAAHAHVAGSLECLEHLEYFHDHVRLEAMLFDGLPVREGGSLIPDRSAKGNGLSLRSQEATRFEI